MKIVRFEAEGFKRLRAVTIVPDADNNLVIVSGKNGAGKSSTLDAIWAALGGGAAAKDTSRPIRDGATAAHVELDLKDLVVTRTWSEGGKTALTVRAADGAKYSSPQSMLDTLVGRLSFDPLAFSQQPAKEQLATLLSLVELPFDPAHLDGQRAGLFDQRTDVGRDVRQLEGQLAGLPDTDDELPPNEISLADLLARREAAVAEVTANNLQRRDLEILTGKLEAAEAHVNRIEAELVESKALAANLREDLNFAQVEVADLVDPDVTVIDNRLRTLDETNRKVRARADREAVAERLAEVQAAQHNLTEQIAAIDDRKAKALAAAKMPIDGLSFDSDGVTYQGVPFKQASSAEQLRVSVAMAMALNPKLRVIRIADGSLLDSDNLALLESMATEHDFQVWLEVVDESGDLGVVIEDGAVRERVPA